MLAGMGWALATASIPSMAAALALIHGGGDPETAWVEVHRYLGALRRQERLQQPCGEPDGKRRQQGGDDAA